MFLLILKNKYFTCYLLLWALILESDYIEINNAFACWLRGRLPDFFYLLRWKLTWMKKGNFLDYSLEFIRSFVTIASQSPLITPFIFYAWTWNDLTTSLSCTVLSIPQSNAQYDDIQWFLLRKKSSPSIFLTVILRSNL